MDTNTPRISLSIGRSSDGPRTNIEISPYGMSLSLYITWLFLTVLNPFYIVDSSTNFTSFGDLTFRSIVIYSFLISNAIFLLAAGLMSAKIKFLENTRLVLIVAVALASFGTMVLLLAPVLNLSALGIAASVIVGAGASLIMLIFGGVYCRFSFASAFINAALSFALAFMFSVVLGSWFPYQFNALLIVFLPILACAPMYLSKSALSAFENESSSSPLADAPEMPMYLFRCFACMTLLGIVMGSLRMLCCEELALINSVNVGLVFCAGAFIAAIILIVCLTTSRKETLWDHIFRIMLPIVMICVALIAAPASFGYFSTFTIAIGYVCVEVLIWIFMTSIAKDLEISSIKIFGIVGGLVQVGGLVGCGLFRAMLPVFGNSLDPTAAFALFGNIFSDGADNISDLTYITIQYKVVLFAVILIVLTAFANAALPRYYELKNMMAAALRRTMHSHDIQTELSAADIADINSARLSNEAAIASDTIESATHQQTAEDENQVDNTESSNNEVVAKSESAQPEPEGASEKSSEKGRFHTKCDKVAEEAGLSNREIDVFRLLAKGHNAGYIMDKLCVSRSTAKTHINHIYKKTGVHSQQELQQLIENTSL